MKKTTLGFTVVELLVVIVVCLVLASMLIPAGHGSRAKAGRINCINNLKQIGVAYRVWPGDQSDRFPSQRQITDGGWGEIAASTNAARLGWTNYFLMQKELGQSPRVLICPADERIAATNFHANENPNANLSYFVGIGASDTYPQSLLGGDRNLAPGPKPADDYGYSPAAGMGADVILSTNADVCWSLKMHSAGNASGAGNVLLGDGSVQQVSSARFRTDLLSNAQDAGLWPPGCNNTNGTIRLLFP